ncbi:MAG: hypothetical protein NT007_07850 [Candidatus Kapabacteria bacterium]|nr:hypothetical protein [Candidatus Kapabacteria bacterium]
MTSLIVTPANTQEFFLLKELLQKMKIEFKPLSIISPDDDDSEDFYKFSSTNLSRAYSDDEPEYTSAMVKEPNLGYSANKESQS